MKINVSENLLRLAESCPYPLYLVGGRVRDFIAKLDAHTFDNDICAPAGADDFATRAQAVGFRIDSVYKNTGTVKLSCSGEDYEFTCFRSDEYVRGVHRPVNTYFTKDITLDAKRRDFRCNAVYYDIYGGQFVDPLGGIRDIEGKILNCVDNSDKVFGEDGLRLMRLARIAAQTGFTPSAECISGAKNNAKLIADISKERIYAELSAVLHADSRYGIEGAQYRGLKILDEIGVLDQIIPELTLGRGMSQRSDIHAYDVLEHSFKTVLYADASIRLAALLHDVGKPYCMLKNGNFYAHETEGAAIAPVICARLRVPKKLAETVTALTKLHMYDLRCDAKENKVRRFIVKNLQYFDGLMLLKQADYSACRDDLSVAPSVRKMTEILQKMKSEGVPLTVKQLNVRGNDLIECGCPPEKVGKVLDLLLMECCINTIKNQREALLNYAQKVAFKSII